MAVWFSDTTTPTPRPHYFLALSSALESLVYRWDCYHHFRLCFHGNMPWLPYRYIESFRQTVLWQRQKVGFSGSYSTSKTEGTCPFSLLTYELFLDQLAWERNVCFHKFMYTDYKETRSDFVCPLPPRFDECILQLYTHFVFPTINLFPMKKYL